MDEPYILILGAGLMQRPAIEAARELGFRTLVVDANPNALCVPFADRFEPVDLKDKDALVALAKSMGKNLAAVFTAGTDFSASVSYVAEKCGLNAHSYEAALNASNKVRMRSCFERDGISSPKFQKVHRTQIASLIAPEVIGSMSFPKVVKPVDNMGARGCRLIRNRDEFLPAVEDAVRFSRTGCAILEDYMEGPEFSIDSIVYDGTLTITGFADRHIFYEPYFIETGHTMPTSVSDEMKSALIKTFAQGIKSLGLTSGVAKADIKYTANGPMIGEIAARLSGGYMSGWTYPYASGINLTKEAMLIALGKKPETLLAQRKKLPIDGAPFEIYDMPCVKNSAERAWISIPGKVSEIVGLERGRERPFVKNTFTRSGVSSIVDFPRNNVEKCGNFISLSEKKELAVESAENAVSDVVLRLESECAETDRFLSGECQKSEQNFPPDAFELDEKLRAELEQSASKMGVIGAGEKVAKKIPICMEKSADNLKDWNHRSIRKTLDLFDEICPEHPEMDALQFWKILVRGGIQGILYYSDGVSHKDRW